MTGGVMRMAREYLNTGTSLTHAIAHAKTCARCRGGCYSNSLVI